MGQPATALRDRRVMSTTTTRPVATPMRSRRVPSPPRRDCRRLIMIAFKLMINPFTDSSWRLALCVRVLLNIYVSSKFVTVYVLIP